MILHVEIPASDLGRAIAFYGEVFGLRFADPVELHESRMAYADLDDAPAGASFALCQGEAYIPTSDGAILYFSVADIDAALARARALGSDIVFPKTPLPDGSYVAEITDSEGNRIALQTDPANDLAS